MSTTTSEQSRVSYRLLSSIRELPLWVKQVIFLDLQKDLTVHFVPDSLTKLTLDDTIAFYVPKLTPQGEDRILDMGADLGKFLLAAKQHLTIFDVCLMNKWSLEMLCTLVVEAFRNNLIEPPNSVKAMGTFEYLANRIRLGEYLVKMDRITPEQLDQALRTQQYIKEALQDHTGLANILINLGYITRQDTEGILFLKEESKKPIGQLTLVDKTLP